MKRYIIFALLIAGVTTSGCSFLEHITGSATTDSTAPIIDREFRAVWIATVNNINWPSQPGLTVEQQQEEAIAMLSLLEELNYNAVIFQVRPQADALYPSELEPWSYFLTGVEGMPPEPFYDPLQFWLDEAHKRNLELHVWLNPYRAHHISGGPITDQSVVRTMPEYVVPLLNGYWWFDPALQETRQHSLDVVMDIVRRYDIDGVHFDDYFYPYPSYNENLDFPDDKSWEKYQAEGGKLSRADWRRQSVNQFIQILYSSIKREKPHVKFGISPFGIWRPGHPSSIQGFDQYDKLYADAKKWLNEGWVDYFTPQLYWPINQIPQSYPVLLGWWKKQNYQNRHLWPGISLYRFEGEKKVDEVLNQIMVARGMLDESPGTVHWSIQPLQQSDTLKKTLKELPYNKPALVPAMKHIGYYKRIKPPVHLQIENGKIFVSHKVNQSELSGWIIYFKYDDQWQYQILSRKEKQFILPLLKTISVSGLQNVPFQHIKTLKQVKVTVLDRFGHESNPVEWKQIRPDK